MIDSYFSNHYVLYLLILIAYILGSIPFGVLVSRRRGINLRATGSGNIGTTNVLRSVGKIPAILTLLGDFLKGAIAVILCRFIVINISHIEVAGSIYTERELWEGIIGLTTIIGHIYPVFLSFKGGKGVATGFGVLSVYSSLSTIIMLIIWILIAVFTRYSSLAALTAFTALPLIFLLSGASIIKISFGILIAILIVLKHKANIKRLIEGVESKIGEDTNY